LAAAIKKAKGIDARLVEGHRGVFEVTADGRLIFSKKQTGRFPEHHEVISQIP
jgi:selT/selW/selH-like putative selenoprotein